MDSSMKKIVHYIRSYLDEVDKKLLLSITILTALLVFCNYYFKLDKWIIDHTFYPRLLYRYCISLFAFIVPYILAARITRNNYFSNATFTFILLIAPIVFSLKMEIYTHLPLTDNEAMNHYWNRVLYWPVRLVMIMLLLFILWKWFYRDKSFFGLTTNGFEWQPYAVMLLIMLPLIASASTQPDFLHMYPKLKMVSGDLGHSPMATIYKLLFELSYGSDFVSIELFFRGFLILGFLQWAGKDAILPMACFYCTIHFGKPLGECISSYFGGILLGIVVYHTRSIFGGLMVHLGIAWLMEAGGYIGNCIFNK